MNTSDWPITGLARSKQFANQLIRSHYPHAILILNRFKLFSNFSIDEQNREAGVIYADVSAILQAISCIKDCNTNDELKRLMGVQRQAAAFLNVICVYQYLKSYFQNCRSDQPIPHISSLSEALLTSIEATACDAHFDDLMQSITVLVDIVIGSEGRNSKPDLEAQVPLYYEKSFVDLFCSIFRLFTFLARSYSSKKKLFLTVTEHLLRRLMLLLARVTHSPLKSSVQSVVVTFIRCCLFDEKTVEELAQHPLSAIQPYVPSLADSHVSASVFAPLATRGRKRARDGSGPGHSAAYYSTIFTIVTDLMKESSGSGSGSECADRRESAECVGELLALYAGASLSCLEQQVRRVEEAPRGTRESGPVQGQRSAPSSNSLRLKHYCRVIQTSLAFLRACGVFGGDPSSVADECGALGASNPEDMIEGKHALQTTQKKKRRGGNTSVVVGMDVQDSESANSSSLAAGSGYRGDAIQEMGGLQQQLSMTQVKTRNAVLKTLSSVLREAGSLPAHQGQLRTLLIKLGNVASDVVIDLSRLSGCECSSEVTDLVDGGCETLWWLLDIDHRTVLGWANEDTSLVRSLVSAHAQAVSALVGHKIPTPVPDSPALLPSSWLSKLTVRMIQVQAALSRLDVLLGVWLHLESELGDDGAHAGTRTRPSVADDATMAVRVSVMLGEQHVQVELSRALEELSASQLEQCWAQFSGPIDSGATKCVHAESATEGGAEGCVGVGRTETEEIPQRLSETVGPIMAALLVPLVNSIRVWWQVPAGHVSTTFKKAINSLYDDTGSISGPPLLACSSLLRLASQVVVHQVDLTSSVGITQQHFPEVNQCADVVAAASEENYAIPCGSPSDYRSWNSFIADTKRLFLLVKEHTQTPLEMRGVVIRQDVGISSLCALLFQLAVFASNVSVLSRDIYSVDDSIDMKESLVSDSGHGNMSTLQIVELVWTLLHSSEKQVNRESEDVIFPLLVRSATLWDSVLIRHSATYSSASAVYRTRTQVLQGAAASWWSRCCEIGALDNRLVDPVVMDLEAMSAVGGPIFDAIAHAIRVKLRAINITMELMLSEEANLLLASYATAATSSSTTRPEDVSLFLATVRNTVALCWKFSFLPCACKVFQIGISVVGSEGISTQGSSDTVRPVSLVLKCVQLLRHLCAMSRQQRHVESLESVTVCLNSACGLCKQLVLLSMHNDREDVDWCEMLIERLFSLFPFLLDVISTTAVTANKSKNLQSTSISDVQEFTLLLADLLLFEACRRRQITSTVADHKSYAGLGAEFNPMRILRLVFDFVLTPLVAMTTQSEDVSLSQSTSHAITDVTVESENCFHVELFRVVCNVFCSALSSPEMQPNTDQVGGIVDAFKEVLQKQLIVINAGASISNQRDGRSSSLACYVVADCLRVLSMQKSASGDMIVAIPPLVSIKHANAWLYLSGVVCCSQGAHGKTLSPHAATFLVEQLMDVVAGDAVADGRLLDLAVEGVVRVLPTAMYCILGLRLRETAHALTASNLLITASEAKVWMKLLIVCKALLHGPVQRDSDVLLQLLRVIENCAERISFQDMAWESRQKHRHSKPQSHDSSLVSMEDALLSKLMSTLSEGMSSAVRSKKGNSNSGRQRHDNRSKSNRARTQAGAVEGGLGRGREEPQDESSGLDRTAMWSESAMTVLSTITSKLSVWMVKGDYSSIGSKRSTCNSTDWKGKSTPLESLDRHWTEVAERCAAVLRVVEQLVGLASPLLGPSVGFLGALVRQLLRGLVTAHGKVTDRHEIDPKLRIAARTLAAMASSNELSKHAGQLSATIIDGLSGLEITQGVRELLLPGLFALFDRCQMRQRKQMSAVLDALAGSLLRDIYETYLNDFKFIGKA